MKGQRGVSKRSQSSMTSHWPPSRTKVVRYFEILKTVWEMFSTSNTLIIELPTHTHVCKIWHHISLNHPDKHRFTLFFFQNSNPTTHCKRLICISIGMLTPQLCSSVHSAALAPHPLAMRWPKHIIGCWICLLIATVSLRITALPLLSAKCSSMSRIASTGMTFPWASWSFVTGLSDSVPSPAMHGLVFFSLEKIPI